MIPALNSLSIGAVVVHGLRVPGGADLPFGIASLMSRPFVIPMGGRRRANRGAGLRGIEQWNTGFTSGFVFPYSTRNQLVNHVIPRYAIDLSSVLVLFYIVYIPYTCSGEIISV